VFVFLPLLVGDPLISIIGALLETNSKSQKIQNKYIWFAKFDGLFQHESRIFIR